MILDSNFLFGATLHTVTMSIEAPYFIIKPGGVLI